MARTAQFVIFAYIVAAAVMCCAQPQPAAEVDNDEPHYIDGHHNPLCVWGVSPPAPPP